MRALANQDRARVLAILCERATSPREMVTAVGQRPSCVAYHLRILRDCGLVAAATPAELDRGRDALYRAVEP